MSQVLSQVDSKKLALFLVSQFPSQLTQKLSHGRIWVNLTQFFWVKLARFFLKMSQSDSTYVGQNWDNMTQFLSRFDSEKILSALIGTDSSL